MKLPLKVEKISDDVDCYEDKVKIIRYKITNENRHSVTNVDVKAWTVKEDGERTRSNYVKKITGIKPRLAPRDSEGDSCEVSITIKLNKEYTETVEVEGKSELSEISLELDVSGKLVIGKS